MGKKKAFHDILQYLRTEWCPKAFALRPPYAEHKEWTAIHDDTGRLYQLPKQLLTGDEIYAAWRRTVVRTLGDAGNRSHKRLVLVCDDQDRVPHRKRKEQAKRKDSQTKAIAKRLLKATSSVTAPALPPPLRSKYTPAQFAFTAAGLLCYETGLVELIDTRTLRGSGEMRKDMYKYFMWRIENDLDLKAQMEPSATLILDFHGAGPCLFQRYRGWVRLAHLQHPFGEADLAEVFWAIVFRTTPCTITTNDRDSIPILYHYCQTQGFQRNGSPLWWVYEPREKIIVAGQPGCLNVMEMTVKLAERWNTVLFLLACCLCGTDYVEKGECTPNAGQDVIFASVQRNKDVASGVKQLVSIEKIEAAKLEGNFDLVTKMQKHNQSSIQCWSQLLDNIKACSRTPKSKSITAIQKLQSLDDTMFNIGYWAQTWAKFNDASEWPS